MVHNEYKPDVNLFHTVVYEDVEYKLGTIRTNGQQTNITNASDPMRKSLLKQNVNKKKLQNIYIKDDMKSA